MEILLKYHFEIEHIEGSNNNKANVLSRKEELQSNNKMSETLLKLKENGKIHYNHPQLAGTHKAPVSL